jgi:4-alpha-glucanotransferase
MKFIEREIIQKKFVDLDMPVYMDYDSADVWANQSLFQLDEQTSLAKAVSGAPPDGFSETGQLWNNP